MMDGIKGLKSIHNEITGLYFPDKKRLPDEKKAGVLRAKYLKQDK